MTNANTKRTGYAKVIMPERLEADEVQGLSVPIADERGVQEGVLPPALRTFGKAQYGVVSLEEADRLAHQRTVGELPPISGGLDDTKPKVEPPKVDPPKPEKRGTRKVKQTKKHDFDPLGDTDSPEPGDPALVAEEQRMAQQYKQAPQAPVVVPQSNAPVPSKYDVYLQQRKRVTLELVDGAMGLSAIDVRETKYGVMVVLPLSLDGMTFIPRPGAEVTVVCGEHRWQSYFPGTYAELEDLGITCLAFVKAEDK